MAQRILLLAGLLACASASWQSVGRRRKTTPSPAGTDILFANQVLRAGQALTSQNSLVKLDMQADGNLVMRQNGVAVWATDTDGQGDNNSYLTLQDSDGNLVVYCNGKSLWSSKPNSGAVALTLGNDLTLEVVGLFSSVLWSIQGTTPTTTTTTTSTTTTTTTTTTTPTTTTSTTTTTTTTTTSSSSSTLSPDIGDTELTRTLNRMMNRSGTNDRTYTGGKGLVVRTPFDGLNDDEAVQVLPSTFWSNDIIAPSQLYPNRYGEMTVGSSNPWCTTDFAAWTCDPDYNGETSPWNYAQLAVVIGTQMDQVFYNFEQIQNDDWDWGVFYATDSNSVDKRCHYVSDYDGWDCPGGWLDSTGQWTGDSSKLGAGGYPPGNPFKNEQWGGGTGCHSYDGGIDQTSSLGNGQELFAEQCSCNTNLRGSKWDKWMSQWLLTGPEGWSWEMDLAACWMNNVRDMIDLQNQFYTHRRTWSNQKMPAATYDARNTALSAAANRPYWGWNEVPMGRQQMVDPATWDAILIKLPAAACGGYGFEDRLRCYPTKYHWAIDDGLAAYIEQGFLGVGVDAAEDGVPSSSVVLVREFRLLNEDAYQREFFCESWGPLEARALAIVYDGAARGKKGCFVDRIPSKSEWA